MYDLCLVGFLKDPSLMVKVPAKSMPVALYGVLERVYTDNGSDFIGTNMELSILRELLCSSVTQDAIHHLSFTKGLQWHFIPS